MSQKSFLSALLAKVGLGPQASKVGSSDGLEALIASVLNMGWFVEAPDPYAGGQLWRVLRYSRMVGEQAGLERSEAARISLGRFLYDLGKIAVPDAILRKTGKLLNCMETWKEYPGGST